MSKLSAFFKETLPFSLYALRYAARIPFFRFKSTKQVFTEIYEDNIWGNRESASGSGSTQATTRVIAERLPALMRSLGAESFLDVPCGDFNWMAAVDLGVGRYVGADIVDGIIRQNAARFTDDVRSFVCLDLMREALPRVDVVFCRDCLVHFALADAMAAIQNFKRSGSTYVMLTTFPAHRRNREMVTGGWRPLNLQIAPFNFPEPVELINEAFEGRGGKYRDKSVGVWRLADIAPTEPASPARP